MKVIDYIPSHGFCINCEQEKVVYGRFEEYEEINGEMVSIIGGLCAECFVIVFTRR